VPLHCVPIGRAAAPLLLFVLRVLVEIQQNAPITLLIILELGEGMGTRARSSQLLGFLYFELRFDFGGKQKSFSIVTSLENVKIILIRLLYRYCCKNTISIH